MTNIVKYSTEELKKLEKNGNDQTNWQRVLLMKDEDIEYDEDSPKITEEMFSKTTITLSLDSDVIEWYTKRNIAYQLLVNKMLRSYMENHN